MWFLFLTLLLGSALVPLSAQQVTDTLGSPSATTSISGKQLPAPDPKFGGVIKGRRAELQNLVAAAYRAA